MKKEYIKPEIEFVDVEMVTMISTSDGDGHIPVVPGEGDEFAPGYRPGRGTWGDLWSEGEE